MAEFIITNSIPGVAENDASFANRRISNDDNFGHVVITGLALL